MIIFCLDQQCLEKGTNVGLLVVEVRGIGFIIAAF